jgi:rhodanese-related sulfurtransferase
LKAIFKVWKRYLIGAFLGAFFALLPVQANAQISLLFGDLSWDRINTFLDKEYPKVASISTQELSKLDKVVLLDTRTLAEYKASHLPGAQRFDDPDSLASQSLLSNLSKDAVIVVYCSVGVRSAAIAKQLAALGYTQVRNLRGSIFMWANEGRSLAGDQAPKVHPFNNRWGALLAAHLRLKT